MCGQPWLTLSEAQISPSLALDGGADYSHAVALAITPAGQSIVQSLPLPGEGRKLGLAKLKAYHVRPGEGMSGSVSPALMRASSCWVSKITMAYHPRLKASSTTSEIVAMTPQNALSWKDGNLAKL